MELVVPYGLAGIVLRISEGIISSETATLLLEGQLMGPWVSELNRFCEEFLKNGRALTLDLAEVSFVDREGVAGLHGMAHRQIALINCPRFLAEQMRAYDDRSGKV